MTALTSNTAGILLLPKSYGDEIQIVDLTSGSKTNNRNFTYCYSMVQDWVPIESSSYSSLIEKASNEYWTERVVSLIQECLSGHESDLQYKILKHVDELLSTRVSSEHIIDRLLIAPLLDKYALKTISKFSLSNGFTVVASILDNLSELQPLIKRFSTIWLNLSNDMFKNFSIKKEEIWLRIIKKGKISNLIKTDDRKSFLNQWNSLAFHFNNPQDRIGVQNIGDSFADSLYPYQLSKEKSIEDLITIDQSENFYKGQFSDLSDYETFKKVEKQISGIINAISVGQDDKANKFLNELIQMQLEVPGGTTYAVKSLCNIAKKSADIFRFDFESICLQKALNVSDSDQWLLIQYGDHFKRIGEFEKALEVLNRAKEIGESPIALSSIADVYAKKGQYTTAIEIYESISDWEKSPTVLTAIADVNRKLGNLEEAEKSYEYLKLKAQEGLIDFLESETRAKVGIAEIAKQRGYLKKASQVYQEVLYKSHEDIDKFYYKMGYCNVLKLMEKYDQAYEVIDDLIQEYPFALIPKFIRGSILGLRSEELQGLQDLPEIESDTFQEWIRHYYRGLILLKMNRYEDAKKCLVDSLPEISATHEEKDILRMGAALWFLGKDKTDIAEKYLKDRTKYRNYYTQYLSLVLNYHIATQKNDLKNIRSISKTLSEAKINDQNLSNAIIAIKKRNFELALKYEADALLKIAA